MARQIGLKDIHIAILTKDDAESFTYDAPIKLERSINAKITPKANTEVVYSEDSIEEIIDAFESCDVEIELNQLSLESRAKLQGANLVDGTLLENKDDNAPVLAFGFRSKKSNGKFRYVWLYKGKFELASDEYETLGEKPKPQSAKLKGTFYDRENDGNWRFMADEDIEGVDSVLLTDWFTAVKEQPEPVV